MAALWNRAGHYIFNMWFLLSCSSFFFISSPIFSRRRLDVYHTSTHGVALVRIWNAGLKCAVRGSLKVQDAKNRQKFAICAPSHNFVGLFLQLRHASTIGKNLLNSNISSTCSHYIVNFDPLTAEIGSGPQQISTRFASWLRYCTDVAQRKSTKLCTMFGRLRGWYTIYTF